MFNINREIRIYFSGRETGGNSVLGYLTYPKTNVFTKCKIIYNNTEYLMDYNNLKNLYAELGFTTFGRPQLLHLSDFIPWSDGYITTLCISNEASALLLYTKDGISFELKRVLNDGEHHREINGFIDGTTFYYIFRGTSGMYLNWCSIVDSEEPQGEKIYMCNASSKPMSFRTENNCYFLLNTSGDRKKVTLYRFDHLRKKIEQVEGFDLKHTFHYGSCLYENGMCYITYSTDESGTSSTQDRANIKLLKFPIN